jgi:hypothetical protein
MGSSKNILIRCEKKKLEERREAGLSESQRNAYSSGT